MRPRVTLVVFRKQLAVVVSMLTFCEQIFNLQSHVIEDGEKPVTENSDLDNTGKSSFHLNCAHNNFTELCLLLFVFYYISRMQEITADV